jgi:hypothetical protein
MLDYITYNHSKHSSVVLPPELFSVMNMTSEKNDNNMSEGIKLITNKIPLSTFFHNTNIIIPVHTYFEETKAEHWMTLIAVNCLKEDGFIVSYDSIQDTHQVRDKAVEQIRKLLSKVLDLQKHIHRTKKHCMCVFVCVCVCVCVCVYV